MELVEGYDEAVGLWESYGVTSAVELSARLDNFMVLFAYNSGRIENRDITYHDTHEIFSRERVCGYTGDLRTLFEIQNLKDASELMPRWFDERRVVDLDLIRDMHREITKGTYDARRWELGERPGQFKVSDRWGVDRHDVSAPVDEVEADLRDDLDEVSTLARQNPLVAAAFWHARFEGVHAFADGNGRTGRAVMNYMLLLNGHPPIVVYDEDRSLYYAALDRFDTSGDLAPLVRFMREECAKTWASRTGVGGTGGPVRTRLRDAIEVDGMLEETGEVGPGPLPSPASVGSCPRPADDER